MTFCELSTGDVISAVETALPAPENPFERAMYFMNLKWVMDELSVFFAREYNDLIELIKDEPSDEYRVVMTCRKESAVDVDKLRTLRPDVYERISYVKASTAEAILSRETLHELCKEREGDNISVYELVNKGDLKRVLPAGDVGQFIKFYDVPTGYAVEEVRG